MTGFGSARPTPTREAVAAANKEGTNTAQGAGDPVVPDGSSQVLAIGLDGMVYHQIRRPDGSWSGFQAPQGVPTATMGASAIGITEAPDGSAHIVAVGLDGRIWHNIRKPDGSWTPFRQIPGPNGSDPFPAGQVRITTLPDSTTHETAISAG
ncbi:MULTISPECIES: hypothetical protein [unclassified Streptomyces]|uniref:hypothetical protein n=1 Tax=unclassified Streptomyces TaxID=2593676 RepID=UPI00226F6DE8|nr:MULTISPECIES: hypothetical protein [unclassified Streptomyces]MCY0924346.1 hypothetical protein [Streptomyces sp. H27-G5]MCY0962259.1 hypothetical protein [Streptomyces sp. H27-H5]